MRNVPLELKQKLLKQFYGSSTDSLPKIQVIAKQASINTLITEIIHEGIPANFGDVAIRQLPGENQPSLAYAACIDNGTGKIYSRKMPAFAEQEWEYLWSLGAVKDIAIEFNGEWKINPKKRYYELFTEKTPHIFFVDNSNNLYVQKWNDEATRLLLADNARQISVCRGWQSNLDCGIDQGLVIGYLRGGKVYYKAYCQQSAGDYLWETENEITQLGIGNTTLCVFRTNDFRIGFLTENSGEIKYVLSHRTYSGQAMRPELAEVQIISPLLWMDNATKYYPLYEEKITIAPDKSYLGCYDKNNPPLEIVGSRRSGLREIVVIFNRNIEGDAGAFERYFTTFPVREVSSCTWQNQNELKITLNQDLFQSLDLELYITKCHEVWQYIEGQKMPIEDMTFTIPGEPIQTFTNESINIEIADVLVWFDYKTEHFAMTKETVTIAMTASIELYPIGIIPI